MESCYHPTVEEAARSTHCHGCEHNNGHRQAKAGQPTSDNAGEANDAAGGKVDSTAYEHKGNSYTDDAGISGDAEDFLNISQLQESGRGCCENRSQNNDKAEGNNLANKFLAHFQGFHSLDKK